MTYGEMQREVYRRLAEATGSAVAFSDADVVTALAAGYEELSDAAEWFEQTVDLTLLNNRPYYDLRMLLGEAFLALGPAFDVQTNKWLLPTTVRQFDAHDRRWERVTGEPQRVLIAGLYWLGFWPRVQADTGGIIRQAFTALPPPLVDDLDEPGFPDTFHYGIVNFALADLWAQDGETQRAIAEWQTYVSVEAALEQWVQHRGADAAMHGYGAIGSVAR